MLIKSNLKIIFKVMAILAVVLFIISFAVALIFGFPIKSTLRVVFGLVYVLFIPGFIWSYVFFPSKFTLSPSFYKGKGRTDSLSLQKGESERDLQKKSLDLIERITLSFALSMALGPLLIFFLNKIGIKINFLNSFIEILVLIIAGLIVISIQEKKKIIPNLP